MTIDVRANRIDILDGLRGYAVLCVFMVHFAARHYKNEYFTSNKFIYYLIVSIRSHLGVDRFFCNQWFFNVSDLLLERHQL